MADITVNEYKIGRFKWQVDANRVAKALDDGLFESYTMQCEVSDEPVYRYGSKKWEVTIYVTSFYQNSKVFENFLLDALKIVALQVGV